jgi:hypothetical protein
MIPLYGFLEGDTLGLLVLAQESTTIAEVAARLRAAASVRAGWEGEATVVHDGRELEPNATVAGAALRPLDRVDVRRRTP